MDGKQALSFSQKNAIMIREVFERKTVYQGEEQNASEVNPNGRQ